MRAGFPYSCGSKGKPDKLPKGVEYVNVSVFGDTKFQILAPTRKSKLALLGCTDSQFDEIMQGIRDSYAYMPYARHAYKELLQDSTRAGNLRFIARRARTERA